MDLAFLKDALFEAVFRTRIRLDLKLFGLKDSDPKLLISDPASDPDPPLFHSNLKKLY